MRSPKLILSKAPLLIATFVASLACAQLPPVVQSVATAIGGTGDAIVNKPAGTLPGDLLVACITVEKGSDATIAATGWTPILRTDNSTDAGLATFYKIAGASEPTTYTFELTGQKWAAGISRITGYSTAKPIDVSGGQTGAPGDVTAPSVTTTAANTLALAFYTNKKGTSYIPAIDTTERYDAPNVSGGAPSNMMAEFLQILPGETGDKTATPKQADQWAAQQVVILPNDDFPDHGLLSLHPRETDGWQVRYQGLPGLSYNVEYTDALLPSDTVWNLIEGQTTDASGRVVVDDTTAAPIRFYRAALVP